jgi:hypothetical protein
MNQIINALDLVFVIPKGSPTQEQRLSLCCNSKITAFWTVIVPGHH